VEVPVQRKEVDDILGGEAAWADKDQTEHRCQNEECDSMQAYFLQIQVCWRSNSET
jgi:DNA-directed RNA polymerase III subunit RPC11